MSREIEYVFLFDDGSKWDYHLRFDEQGNLLEEEDEKPAAWTKLDFHQCPNCPLKIKDSPCCPVAKNLHSAVEDSKNCRSVREATITVETPERIYSKKCTVQEGLRSLFGLIMASSACPHFGWLKPLARFHLPFSEAEETYFRVLSVELLRKFFLEPAMASSECGDEIQRLYGEVEKVNHSFIKRIRAHCEADADKNALATLDAFIQLFPYQMASNFELLRRYF